MTEQQHAEVVIEPPVDRQALWSPIVGAETTALVDLALSDQATRAQVLKQTTAILARCVDPAIDVSGPRTGLVIGYVQSGKTLSFTAVTAMARDNGFPLVVLLAGTKIPLHEQTADRLRGDLRVERPSGMSPWTLLSNPEPTSDVVKDVATQINTMLDSSIPAEFKRTTVITIMKNTNRLDKLGELLGKLSNHGVDLNTLPVIVIDDEADQAGMNAGRTKEGVKSETATYSSILGLRDVVPNSSYVMYTATPQAPLLISLADALSPDFVNVLKPGPGYTGGAHFFDEHRDSFVKIMTDDEVVEALDAGATEPPSSLEAALATFFLMKAIVGSEQLVSMLVHPSHLQELHTIYGRFVRQLVTSWSSLLAEEGPDRDELIEVHFAPAYRDLQDHTGREIQGLRELMPVVRLWMNATQVRVVNSDPSNNSELNWDSAPVWIVIGGNNLDRGFTIEGLAVTHMPRGMGVGNADTIQQRARFFGYKKSYGDLCRAWLPVSLADGYENYVDHEENLRDQMIKVEEEGTSLKSWTRKMLLDASFKATRRAVIEIPFLHSRFRGNVWSAVDRIGNLGPAGQENRDSFAAFRNSHRVEPIVDERDPRPSKHTRFTVGLSEVVGRLLVDWNGHIDDRVLVQQLVLVLQAHLDEQPDLLADIYLMDNLAVRKRGLASDNCTVSNLQQGRNPGGGYPGDKVFFTDDRFSLQVHDVTNRDDAVGTWSALGLTFRLPESLAGAALVEYPGGEQ